MVLIETVVTGIVDEFPRLGLNWILRLLTTILVAVFFCLLGLPQTTQVFLKVLRSVRPVLKNYQEDALYLECRCKNLIVPLSHCPHKVVCARTKSFIGKFLTRPHYLRFSKLAFKTH